MISIKNCMKLLALLFLLPLFSSYVLLFDARLSRRNGKRAIAIIDEYRECQSIKSNHALQRNVIFQINPFYLKIQDKVLNIWGIWFGVVVLCVTCLSLPGIAMTAMISDISGDRKVSI